MINPFLSPKPHQEFKPAAPAMSNRKFTAAQVRDIREGAAAGVSVTDLSKEFGVGHGCIRKIIDKEYYKDVE